MTEFDTKSGEIKKLRYIKSSDNISFNYNYEALNACFGQNMRSSLEKALWNSKDGCLVWFPHMAKLENGRYIPGSSQVNWKNYFEEDGNIIIQMLYDGEYVNSDKKLPTLSYGKEIMPLHTFMKMGDRDYRYAGTYMLDYNSSSLRNHVVRRIKDGIDLSVWASGHDTDYNDTSVIGKDVFKDFYISRSFDQQRLCTSTFNENYSVDDEEVFNREKALFIEDYSMNALARVSEEQYINEFMPRLVDLINKLFETDYSSEKILNCANNLRDFGSALMALVGNREISVNDGLRESKFGSKLAGILATIYDSQNYDYLYTIDEETTDKFIYALGIENDEKDDLIDKQAKLYFWRYCDDEILDWSIYKFYRFLCYMSSIKKKSIQYIAAPKSDVKKRIENEEKKYDEELKSENLNDAPKSFVYNSSPRASEIKANTKIPKEGNIVPRHADRRINALVKAGYCCEIDKDHPTFKRRNSDKNYTETHHLIPIEFSAEFEYTLDTEENIVSLCSNCHNQIHYGEGAEKLIKQLFEERRDALLAAGLGETIKGVKVDYIQLLHMYGLD